MVADPTKNTQDIHNKEHEENSDAKRVSSVDSSGDLIGPTNPLPVKITDGTDTADVIETNGFKGLVAVAPGHVSTDNSTNSTLTGDEVFTGEWEDVTNFGVIVITTKSSHASATDGLCVEFSSDGVNVDSTDAYTLLANTGKTWSFQTTAKFFRVVFTNGSTQQTFFRLQTVLKPYYVKPSSHRIEDNVSKEDDAELVTAVLKSQTNTGDEYSNIDVQNPLPTDGDSVYAKDVDLDRVVDTNWTGINGGTVSDLFGDIDKGLTYTGTDNPKTLILWFKRPVITYGMGIVAAVGSFSNTKVSAITAAGFVDLIDESSDDTDKQVLELQFVPTGFSGLRLQFFTADDISLSTVLIAKSRNIIARLQAAKPDGTVVDLSATSGGVFKTSLEEYESEVFLADPLPVREPLLTIARGLVTGMSSVTKFGRNIEIDSSATADIWDGGYTVASGGVSLIWVAPTQARIHAIVSTSDNDSDSGGTNPQSDGARTMRVFGLTDWDTAEVNEDIILDGTNPVNTINSYVIIHRMRVLTKGNNAAGPNVGVLTATAATDGTITAQIRAAEGQTQMAIYGIPSTQKAYIGRLYANTNKAGGAAGLLDVSFLSNPEPQTELTNFLTKHTFGLQTVGTSAFSVNYYTPKVIEGPAIIKVQASSNTNDMDVSAGFDFVLVDN